MEEQAQPFEYKEESVYERLYRQSFARSQLKPEPSRPSQLSGNPAVVDELIEKGRLAQARKNELRRKHEQALLSQLKSKPQINRYSEKILKHKAQRDQQATTPVTFTLRAHQHTVQVKGTASPTKPNGGSQLFQSLHSTLSLEQARDYKTVLERRKLALKT